MTRPQHGGIFAVILFAGALTLACSPREAAEESAPQQPAATSPEMVATQVVSEFLSVPATDVSVISAEAQEFNDSSLGCPVPGMSYMQVLTPGHRVVVEADGRRFDIRVSGGHGKICHRQKPGQKPSKPPQPPASTATARVS